MIWFQVDTADNDKIVGMARFANPVDRSQFADGTLAPRPDNDTGYQGNCPCPFMDLESNPATPLYRWNGTDPEAL
jgi:hypothetical protein